MSQQWEKKIRREMAGPQCPKEPARESAAGQCGSKSQAVFAAWTPCAAETRGPVAPGPDPRAEPVQLLSDCRQSKRSRRVGWSEQAAAVCGRTVSPVHIQRVLSVRTEVKRNQTKALFAQSWCFCFFFFLRTCNHISTARIT